jgi:catechol 2,3-dioxygenase-like lactoylglutathione lyase family enzyme
MRSTRGRCDPALRALLRMETPMTATLLPFDHLVILVADLEQAIADYTALGFTVQRGGTHAAGSTHNALVGFADGSYLELIAFLRPDASHRWGAWAARGHQGFVDYALLPPSVGSVVARAQAAGVAYSGPVDGGRIRLDGAVLQWQIGLPPSRDLPFLCGDVTPRALRVCEGAVRVHANGVQGIASVTVLVQGLADSAARLQAVLGSPPVLPPLPVAGAGLQQAVFAIGQARLVLVAPGPDAEHPLARAWQQQLRTVGEGVIGLSLQGPQGTARALPRTQTHGAAIDVLPG